MAEINDQMDARLSTSVSELLSKADLVIDDCNVTLLNVKSSFATINSNLAEVNDDITTITSTIESANTTINNLNTEVTGISNNVTSIADKVIAKECNPKTPEDFGYNANIFTDTGIYVISSAIPLASYPQNQEFPALISIKSVSAIVKNVEYQMITQEIRPLLKLERIAQRTGMINNGTTSWAPWRYTPTNVENKSADSAFNISLGVRSIALGGTGANTASKALSNLGAVKLRMEASHDFNLLIEPGWFFVSEDTSTEYLPVANHPPASSLEFYVLIMETDLPSLDRRQFALSKAGELFSRDSYIISGTRYFHDWIRIGQGV